MIATEALPRRGAAVFAGERRVGTLGSVCRSPNNDKPIGLASVDREGAAPGGWALPLGTSGAQAVTAGVPIDDP